MAFIAFAYLITDSYSLANIVLLNAVIGPEAVTTQWHFWFIEVLVYLLAAMTALLAIPWVHRAERRFPLLFPLAITGAGLLTRYELVDPGVPHTAPALWLFALGWAIARSRTVAQRCVVSVLAAVTVPGFFENATREFTVVAGILLLIWLPTLPVPKVFRRLTVLLASASLYAYLVHWVVYPPLAGISPALAVAASLAAGVAYWAVCMRVMGAAGRWKINRRRDVPAASWLRLPEAPGACRPRDATAETSMDPAAITGSMTGIPSLLRRTSAMPMLVSPVLASTMTSAPASTSMWAAARASKIPVGSRNPSGVSTLSGPSISSIRSPSASEIGPGTECLQAQHTHPPTERERRSSRRGTGTDNRNLHQAAHLRQAGIGGAADNQGIDVAGHVERQLHDLGDGALQRRRVVDSRRLVRDAPRGHVEAEGFPQQFSVGVEQSPVRRRQDPDDSYAHGSCLPRMDHVVPQ